MRESRDYDSAVRARFLTAQWAVAPIEVAGFESRRACIFYAPKDIIIAFEEIWNNLLTALS